VKVECEVCGASRHATTPEDFLPWWRRHKRTGCPGKPLPEIKKGPNGPREVNQIGSIECNPDEHSESSGN